jgi:hypothetical protein
LADFFIENTFPAFPDGTTVGAYLARGQAGFGGPLGSPVNEQTVASGQVTFTGLAPDVAYVVFGLVSGEWRRIGFRTDPLPIPSIGPPGPPGVGGAVDEADVGYDIVILAGQSNMVGAGGAADSRYDPFDQRIYQFPAYGANINTIVSAVDPLGHPSGAASLGPGLPWARWYVGAIPPNRRVLLVPVAWGGTGFVGTDTPGRTWKIDNTGALALYPAALVQARAALAAAGQNSRYAAILWHQGEADASATPSATYQANLDDLIDAFRSDLGVPDLPFVCGQLVPDNFVSQPYKKVIDDILLDTPRRKLRTGFGYGISGHATRATTTTPTRFGCWRGPCTRG